MGGCLERGREIQNQREEYNEFLKSLSNMSAFKQGVGRKFDKFDLNNLSHQCVNSLCSGSKGYAF